MPRTGHVIVVLLAAGAVTSLALIVSPPCALGQWAPGGTPVCRAPLNQQTPHVVSDDDGGVIIAWEDDRDSASTGFNIYAQRLDAAGIPQWSLDGVPVCTLPGDQFNARPVSDGAHGAIIAWIDTRSGTHYDVYAQRIDASGVPLWSPNGVRLAISENNKYYTGLHTPIASDGMGGAIVIWEERITGFNLDLYAQRLNPNGVLQWGSGGLPVCTAASFQSHATLISDSAGGAIAAWEDDRDYPAAHIYVQHLNADGASLWNPNGVLLSNSATNQQEPNIIAAGHGALVSWIDYLDSNTGGIVSQRIDSSGTPLWTPGGVIVAAAPGPRDDPVALANPDGDFVVAWTDCRTGRAPYGSDLDIYAQRISSQGVPQWQPNGIPVCVAPFSQGYQAILPDGAGGVMLIWQDQRRDFGLDIYAQRLDAAGAPQWTNGGIPISDTTTFAFWPVAVSDGGGGVITVWADDRNGKFNWLYATNWDIYAGHVTNDGTLDVVTGPTTYRLLAPRPNPSATSVTVSFRLGTAARVRIDVLSITGERVRNLAAGTSYPPGDHSLIWDGRDSVEALVPAGVYLLRLSAGPFASMRKVVVLR